MKMIKEKVIKEIPENLISTYLAMGWVKYEEKVVEKPKIVTKVEIKKTEKEQ